jgi:hypothetical protein
LRSAKKYKLERQGFDSLNTPFVADMRRSTTTKYRLFRFDILEAINPGELLSMSIGMTGVAPLQVVAPGMSGCCDKPAQAAYDGALPAVPMTLEKRGVTQELVRGRSRWFHSNLFLGGRLADLLE